ncbi:toll/interleukin-1 receptor domain-containing protein [Pseudomonas atacamensis]|uniref:toll/interleukin-1 receptor domain-containing protein n=1 Tax=Pseudomonas atacamensis TaxID=2565368 RepID=UPI001FAC1E13|nr:toll/interleukin-1 receptor domain-containing protein [Pseudomonas atacamensis]MCI9876950.1 toll/interleukin-1 receptor domain-containing protein [Pseudomonas atacamensis]
MARNVTRTELKNIAANASRSRHFTKSLAASAHNLTFISHSSKDGELVEGAVEVIANHGGIPYIDDVDPAMPSHTSEETAQLLKKRIVECKRFVLLTSPNSKDSRWVPWELGVADGKRGFTQSPFSVLLILRVMMVGHLGNTWVCIKESFGEGLRATQMSYGWFIHKKRIQP